MLKDGAGAGCAIQTQKTQPAHPEALKGKNEKEG